MNYSNFRYPVLIGTLALFVLSWWFVAYIGNNAQTDVGPVSTWYKFVQLFSDTALRSRLISAVQTTMVSIFLGFGLAVIVGVPVGVFMGRYLLVDRFLEPWVDSWYSIPAIAFVPLTMNWTGLTWVSAMVTGFLVAVFSIIINVQNGVKNCSGSLVEPALAYGATNSQVLYKVILPASLPNMMLGLRLGMSRAIEGVIIAEMIFTVVGLGGMIDASADQLQLALSYALIVILIIITISLSAVMRFLDRKVVTWNESQAMVRD